MMTRQLFIAGTALLGVLVSNQAQSQTYVQGGLNLSNITKTNDGQTEKNNTLTTFNVGIMNRFGLSKVVDFELGLLLAGKGSKAETYFNGGNDYVKSRFNPLYIEMPLNLVVKAPLSSSVGAFFNAGPYVAVGVGGKSETESKIGPLTSTSSANIQFSNDDPFTSSQEDAAYNKLKRFDYGLNVGGGLDFKKVLIKLNYGLGLTKINSTESNNSSNDKNKYRTFSISLGFKLN